jgi:ATP-dependent DNA helicase Q4
MCYALPASIMSGICIVVSPLISLMEDQLRRIHPSITAVSFSGNLTSAQMAVAMDDLIKGRLKIIFISPERLLSPAFRRLLRPKLNSATNMYERELPPVSLLCVDEAHCLSQVRSPSSCNIPQILLEADRYSVVNSGGTILGHLTFAFSI